MLVYIPVKPYTKKYIENFIDGNSAISYDVTQPLLIHIFSLFRKPVEGEINKTPEDITNCICIKNSKHNRHKNFIYFPMDFAESIDAMALALLKKELIRSVVNMVSNGSKIDTAVKDFLARHHLSEDIYSFFAAQKSVRRFLDQSKPPVNEAIAA